MTTMKWTGDPECKPTRGYVGDAGFDLYVSEDTVLPYREVIDVPCGISVELPEGTWGMLTGRSSTIRQRGLLVAQGIIDNGYRGELFVAVHNISRMGTLIKRGERIAQLLLFDLVSARVSLERVAELTDSDRGVAAFGSTGR